MAQRTITPTQEIEEVAEKPAENSVATCRHHWVIQPADGPVSNGSCQNCGETREFKNYVESATWGDSRAARKSASASAAIEPTSDDDQPDDSDMSDDGPEVDMDVDDDPDMDLED